MAETEEAKEKKEIIDKGIEVGAPRLTQAASPSSQIPAHTMKALATTLTTTP